jgi:putative transposase
MPEHAHLLLLPHEGVTMRQILLSIKQPVAQRALRWVRRNAPEFLPSMEDRQPSGRCRYRFWQPGPGYDRNTWTQQELQEKIHYIHDNPIRRGLVARPEDWPWSSWRAWESGEDELVTIDRQSFPTIQR